MLQEVQVLPSPANSVFRLVLSSTTTDTANVQMKDSKGSMLSKWRIDGFEGMNVLNKDLSARAAADCRVTVIEGADPKLLKRTRFVKALN